MARVAFVGLGAMGRPMAACLIRKGIQTCVVRHRDSAAVEGLRRAGASVAATPEEAARSADIVVTMLPDSPQVRNVLFGPDGVVAGASAGTMVIDMSTIAPSAARSIAVDLESAGLSFLDAPVSGGPARAQDGSLSIMVGGEGAVLDRARPILGAMGQRIFHVGSVGTGQVVKACNNLLVGTIMLANIEALTLGLAAGVEAGVLREIIMASSGSNWQLENVVPRTLLSHDHNVVFALRHLHKDLGIAEDMAREKGVPLFLGTLARQLYGLGWADAGGDPDFTAVAGVYLKRATDSLTLATARREAPA